jgi:hypothetical protein
MTHKKIIKNSFHDYPANIKVLSKNARPITSLYNLLLDDWEKEAAEAENNTK